MLSRLLTSLEQRLHDHLKGEIYKRTLKGVVVFEDKHPQCMFISANAPLSLLALSSSVSPLVRPSLCAMRGH